MLFEWLKVYFPDVGFWSHYPTIGALVRYLDAIELKHIDTLGLSHLCDIPDIWVIHDLLIALVEHFHLKMNTFHLPLGDMTITRKDIYWIL